MGDSYESEDGDDHLGGGAKGQIELAFFPLALHFSKAFPIQEADRAGSPSITSQPSSGRLARLACVPGPV